MNVSFLSTIAFGLLALAMTFTANLVGLALTGNPAFKLGIALALFATFLSYLAQSNFTASAEWLARHRQWTAPGYAGPADPDAYEKHQRRERTGTILQMAAVTAGAVAAISFIAGSL